MPSKIDLATWEIATDLGRHSRFRFVKANAASHVVLLLGTVIDTTHRQEAGQIAKNRWTDIHNGIDVAVAAFVIYHLIVDAIVLNLAWLIKHTVPTEDHIFHVVHEASMVLLFVLLFADLCRHVVRQLR
jgi:hypothetical protein